jgi:hypothetical protein
MMDMLHRLNAMSLTAPAIRAAPEPRGGCEAPAPWGRFGRCPALPPGATIADRVSGALSAVAFMATSPLRGFAEIRFAHLRVALDVFGVVFDQR